MLASPWLTRWFPVLMLMCRRCKSALTNRHQKCKSEVSTYSYFVGSLFTFLLCINELVLYFAVFLSTLRLRITLTANGRNDHVTMFIPHLCFAVFIFSAKLSSFALAPKARIILHHSHPCTRFFFRENINANLTFAVCRKRDS